MDTRKLFEHIGAGGANPAAIDVKQPKLRATFFETPTINFYLHQFTPQFSNTTFFSLSQMRDYRMAVQANFFEKEMVIKQNGFRGNAKFENANIQFDWINNFHTT